METADYVRIYREQSPILAIKQYRGDYGVGLKVAKEALEKMVAEAPPAEATPIQEDELVAFRRAMAVRQFRAVTGADLAEATRRVEGMTPGGLHALAMDGVRQSATWAAEADSTHEAVDVLGLLTADDGDGQGSLADADAVWERADAVLARARGLAPSDPLRAWVHSLVGVVHGAKAQLARVNALHARNAELETQLVAALEARAP